MDEEILDLDIQNSAEAFFFQQYVFAGLLVLLNWIPSTRFRQYRSF